MLTISIALMVMAAQDAGQFKGHTREVSCVAVSPNGKMVASGGVDHTVRLWDSQSKRMSMELTGHDGEVHCVAFSPDGKLLASGEMYKKLKIWDVATGKELHTYADSEGAILGVTFSRDGKRVFAACKDNAARVWTVGSDGQAVILKHNWAVNGIAASPDGKTIATIDDGGSINIWDASTLKQVATWNHASGGKALAFSGDGKTLVSGGGGVVKIWDFAEGKERGSFECEANAVAVAADGSSILVGTQDNLTILLKGADLSVVWKQEQHERPVTGAAISPDGSTAFTSSMDYTLRAWRLK